MDTITTYRLIATRLGDVLCIAQGSIIIGLYLAGQKNYPEIQQEWIRDDSLALFDSVCKELNEYFSGNRHYFSFMSKALSGTSFQLSVWKALGQVPYGTIISYAQLATSINKPTSVRAVASAVGKNPLSIIIPCHRVVGSDGALRGYAGGLQRKQSFLDLEQKFLNKERRSHE